MAAAHTQMTARPDQVVFRPLGPTSEARSVPEYTVTGGRPITIGRSSEAEWSIPDPGVSRRHARIEFDAGRWLIFDLGSRHGTTVNGQRLANGERITLTPGDVVGLGDWRFVFDSPERGTASRTIMDTGASRVAAVERTQFAGLAQRRLDSLINATRKLSKATDRDSIARVLCAAAAEGTGNVRVLVLRRRGEAEYEQVAPRTADSPVISQSLLQGAAKGATVQLLDQSPAAAGMSLVDLNIRTAICAPLMVAGAVDSFLYLDTRGKEQSLPPDAVAFCSALADLGGLSIERILAADLEARRRELERDLEAARTAQELLMPGLKGRVGSLTYAFHAAPGRYVAGDFFDVVELSNARVAFFLGDVSGKGVGAGVLMAAAQGALRALLSHGIALVDALRIVNVHLCNRTDSGKFITLVAGVFDPVANRLELADAGHGLCCLRPPNADPVNIDTDADLPLGVDSNTAYAVCTLTVHPGTRLILFSDGAIEQPDPQGQQFGWASALAALAPAESVEADVKALVEAVTAHAAGPLADDLTVASLRFECDRV